MISKRSAIPQIDLRLMGQVTELHRNAPPTLDGGAFFIDSELMIHVSEFPRGREGAGKRDDVAGIGIY